MVSASSDSLYEDLTQLDYDPVDDQPVDTSNFKGAGVNELFVSGGAGGEVKASTYDEVDSPIRQLKETILSLDWEITDENIDRFSETVVVLQEQWHEDEVVLTFLKVLMSLGKYIGTYKSNAHADSINLLFSVYNALEKIALSPEMEAAEKEKLLNEELLKLEMMKRAIAKAMAANLEEQLKKAEAQTGPDSPKALILPLKLLVLAIDQDVSDETMIRFNQEIKALQGQWSDDEGRVMILKLLRTLGEYVHKNKAGSLPSAVKLLTAVYNSLEQLVLIPTLTEDNKKLIVKKAVKKFYLLKKEISLSKEEAAAATPAAEMPAAAVEPAAAAPGITASFEPSATTGVAALSSAGEAESDTASSTDTLTAKLDTMFPDEGQEDGVVLMAFDQEAPSVETDAGGPPAALSAAAEQPAGPAALSVPVEEEPAAAALGPPAGFGFQEGPPAALSAPGEMPEVMGMEEGQAEDALPGLSEKLNALFPDDAVIDEEAPVPGPEVAGESKVSSPASVETAAAEEIPVTPAAAVGAEESAGVATALDRVTDELDRLQETSRRLADKMEMLTMLQLFQSVTSMIPLIRNNIDPEMTELLKQQLGSFQQMNEAMAGSRPPEFAKLHETIGRLCQLALDGQPDTDDSTMAGLSPAVVDPAPQDEASGVSADEGLDSGEEKLDLD